LPGCTTGSHSSEQVAKPAPVSTSATTEPVSAPTSIDGTVETYGTSQRMVTTPIPTPVVVEEKKSEPLEQDDPSIPVERGTKCKRKGCNAVYESDEVSRGDGPEAQCVFHPGYFYLYIVLTVVRLFFMREAKAIHVVNEKFSNLMSTV
jgi:hypothetical protein